MKRRFYHPQFVKAARDKWGLRADHFAVLADGTVYKVLPRGWRRVRNRPLADRIREAIR